MPHSESLPTPANPAGSGTTYHASTTITASASLVWSVILDLPSYEYWNSFTRRVIFPSAISRPLQVGDVGELDAHLASPDSPPRLTQIQVSHVDIPKSTWGEGELSLGEKYVLAWKGLGFPAWSLRPERVFEVKSLEKDADGKERCQFTTWETMAGPLAMVVRRVVGADLDGAFERCSVDLKKWVEEGMGKRRLDEKGNEDLTDGK